ncbi:MAG TPA: hypothetical protein VE954_43110 [Oligoflexus sp.]|uniref:hypothetical protein n=1 Tax=Oligoflexus sp. TaxID=1971216 RepID=UPI002D558DD0|nr:hypothetical protein [Oligoflexus sp.]HYX39934.1 hypothetical protein [Oligoflexus sp.]
MAKPQIGQAGTASIDPDMINREPSAEERAAAAARAQRDKQILKDRGMLPGAQGNMPGTLQIDPVVAGWQPDPAKLNQMLSDAVGGYASAKLGYTPYQTQAGPQMQKMNFNPYQQAARNQAHSQAAGGLAQTTGMSTADRMRSFSDFNRAKITGQLGASSKVGQAQAQNMTDVGRFNAGRAMDVNQANAGAFNQASQFRADAGLRRDQNLYNGAMADRNLGRQLEISQLLAQSQGKDRDGGWLANTFGKMWDGVDKMFGG